jgi:hypothetical protein
VGIKIPTEKVNVDMVINKKRARVSQTGGRQTESNHKIAERFVVPGVSVGQLGGRNANIIKGWYYEDEKGT